MSEKNCAGKGLLRPAIIVALGLALVALPLFAKERRGARLFVENRDGTVVQGELLAVRGENILLREVGTDQGITESLRDVQTIRVARKRSFGRGAGKGLLYGGLGGAVLTVALSEANAGSDPSVRGASAALVGGLYFGAIGALVGGIAGGLSGPDDIYVVERTDAEYLVKLSLKLRRLARDRS